MFRPKFAANRSLRVNYHTFERSQTWFLWPWNPTAVTGRAEVAPDGMENWRNRDRVNQRSHGYIDVGDGCWRRNVLVTSLRYCQYHISDSKIGSLCDKCHRNCHQLLRRQHRLNGFSKCIHDWIGGRHFISNSAIQCLKFKLWTMVNPSYWHWDFPIFSSLFNFCSFFKIFLDFFLHLESESNYSTGWQSYKSNASSSWKFFMNFYCQ